MDMRARSLLLFVGVPLLGGYAVVEVGPWDAGWMALWFALAGLVMEARPVRLNAEVRGSITTVATGLAILLGGAQAAVAVAVGAAVMVVSRLSKPERLLKGSYNLGMLVLATLFGARVFEWLAGAPTAPMDSVGVGPWLGAIIAAQFAHHIGNLVLLSCAMAATGGPHPQQTLPPLLRSTWWSQVTSPALAIIAYVVFVGAGPAGLLLLLVPALSAHRSLSGLESQRASLDRAVRSLVRLVEVKDRYTRGHAERVADISDKVAARMGLGEEERYWIRIGAVLHDVGKVGVPIEVLNKPGGFTSEEHHQMRRHPDLGADLLEHVEALEPVVPLVRQHHERLDGCGYPRGLAADDLPLSVRIISAVDSWDAMTTTRPYRTALPASVAVAELRAHTGTQFDGDVVETLIGIVAPEYAMEPQAVTADNERAAAAPVPEVAT